MLTGKALGQALKAAMDKKGVKAADVARHFGVKPPSVHDWIEHGRISKARIPAVIAYFSNVVGPEHWGFPEGFSSAGTDIVVSGAGDVLIPQYDTGGMGGVGLILRDQPGVIQSWAVSTEWARSNIPHCTGYQNLCIVTGFGNSMPGIYRPGDPLLVDLGVKVADHDGVYFFRVGDEGFIKILQRIPGVGIRVISQNKDYEPWTITPDMNFEVFGKVLRAWKGDNY